MFGEEIGFLSNSFLTCLCFGVFMIPLSLEVQQLVEKEKRTFYAILKKALKIKKEQVLIISDYGNADRSIAPMVGYGYYYAAMQKKLKVSLLYQQPKKGFMVADDHILTAVEHLPRGSVIIIAVSNKLGRFGEGKSFRSFCRERGHRFISATGLGDLQRTRFELFLDCMNVNYKAMKKKGLAIKKLWDKAKEIRVKTEEGTDVLFNVEGMEAVANIGEYHLQGEGGNMPAGEVYIPPFGVEGVEGKVVLNGSVKTEQGAFLLDEPLTLFIEKGKLVRMEGKHAELLEKTFEKFAERSKHPERIRFVSELGIGINPAAILVGSTLIDEKVLGTAHIALGSNSWFGGEIKSIFHGDFVFKNPVFYVDGKRMEL